MKKLFSIVLASVLTFTLAACGCQAQDPTPATTIPTTMPATTAPTTVPTTEPATVPSTNPPMDPTMETNIPDPSVDTSMPDMTGDATEGTSGTNENGTKSQNNMQDSANSRMRMK